MSAGEVCLMAPVSERKSQKVFDPGSLAAHAKATALTMEIDGGCFVPGGVGVRDAGGD